MAWTQQELETIEQAYKSGVKKVKFKDRETEFRDLSEMQTILREARAELNGSMRAPYVYKQFGRGYQ